MYSVKGGLLCVLRQEPKSASFKTLPPLSIKMFSGYHYLCLKLIELNQFESSEEEEELVKCVPIRYSDKFLRKLLPLYHGEK